MNDNHILPFLWMRGEEPEILRTEIERIYQAGIRSVCLESRPHPDFAGEGWWRDVDIVIDEARRRDMRIWILDDAHFPTGTANGGIRRQPEHARRFLYTDFVDVTGPLPAVQVDVDLLMTERFTWMDIGKSKPKPLWDETELLSVIAARISDGDTITGIPIDLTDKVQDGYLTVDLGEGTWRIFVNFSTTAIGAKPDYINYVDAQSVRVLIDEVYEKHYEKYGDLFGNVIAGFFSDEPGFYNLDVYDENCNIGRLMPLPWGKELAERLTSTYDGDFYRDIPYLFAPESSGAHRFARVAYMDAVSALYEKNFSRQLGDWCRARGVEYIGHVVEDNCGHMRLGPGCGHYFRAMAGQDMAGIDNIGYQLMPGNDVAIRHTGVQDSDPEFYHYELGKLGGSAAAIDPAKHGRLMCENFGAYGWRLGVRDMKWLVDYLVGQGVNYFVPHAFSMAEYPDADCPPHFYARGNNPQFPYFCELMRYSDRLCRLFSDGVNVPQVGVLYEAEADWAGRSMRGSTVGKELITHQIDFEFLPADVFSNADYYGCRVSEGRLIVNERTMSALIVPECEFIPAAAAEFVRRNPDLPVVYINSMPIGIADAPDPEGTLLSDATRRARTVPLAELSQTLQAMGICDTLRTDRVDRNLHQYHYRKDGQDIWMLMNVSSSEVVEMPIELPEAEAYGRYDAMRDRMDALPVAGGRALLRLRPYETWIICTNPQAECESTDPGELAETLALADFSLELKEIGKEQVEDLGPFGLQPVSALRRDFSGEMIYTTTITITGEPKRAILSAEHVFECMTVEVNGRSLPAVLTPPYEIDLASALHDGENTVKIHVVSTPLRHANTLPGIFGKERTCIEPTGMFGDVVVRLYR